MAEAPSLPQRPNAEVLSLQTILISLEQMHTQLVDMKNLKPTAEIIEKEGRAYWEESKKLIEMMNADSAIDPEYVEKMCREGSPETLDLYKKISSVQRNVAHLKTELGLVPEQRAKPRYIFKPNFKLPSAKSDQNNPLPFALEIEPSPSTSESKSSARSSTIGPSLQHFVIKHFLAKPEPDSPDETSEDTSADPSDEDVCPESVLGAMTVRPDPGPENAEDNKPLDMSMKNLSIGGLTDEKRRPYEKRIELPAYLMADINE